jgi:recombination protein RecA
MAESKELQKLLDTINKKHGQGSVILGNEVLDVPIICSTGSLKLDIGLGLGGLPENRIIEYFGGPSGGKSLLAQLTAKEVQKNGGLVAFLDYEHTFDRDWFTKLGGDPNKLLYSQPNTGDEGFDIAEEYIKSGLVSFIIFDSVSAMATTAELEGDYGDAHIGQLARLMSQGLKKINAVMKDRKTTILFINQIRDRIGTFSPHGVPSTTSGGHALEFYASIRCSVNRGQMIGSADSEEGIDGFITNIKVVKNKCGAPFQKIETNIYVGGKDKKYGIDIYDDLANVAVEFEIIRKAGSWYSYGDERMGQGKESVIKYFKENDKIYQEIKQKVYVKLEEKKQKNKVEDSFDSKVQELDNKEIKRRIKKDEHIYEEANVINTNLEGKE